MVPSTLVEWIDRERAFFKGNCSGSSSISTTREDSSTKYTQDDNTRDNTSAKSNSKSSGSTHSVGRTGLIEAILGVINFAIDDSAVVKSKIASAVSVGKIAARFWRAGTNLADIIIRAFNFSVGAASNIVTNVISTWVVVIAEEGSCKNTSL